jgi:hypothetical protein
MEDAGPFFIGKGARDGGGSTSDDEGSEEQGHDAHRSYGKPIDVEKNNYPSSIPHRDTAFLTAGQGSKQGRQAARGLD